MPYGENMCVGKLPGGMNCNAVGHEFKGKERAIYIKEGVFKAHIK